jgi:F0F1-type ATP synthase assembly protein I
MGRLLAMGSVLSGLAVVGVGGGYLIDHARGTSPRWTLILGVLSIILGLYQIVRMGSRP